MGLPGMAKPMTASPGSPLRSRVLSGTVLASLASGTDLPWGLDHEDDGGQNGPLRHLYPRLHRPRIRSRIQLAGRTVRRSLGIYKESGPRRLDADPIALRRRRVFRWVHRSSRSAAIAR